MDLIILSLFSILSINISFHHSSNGELIAHLKGVEGSSRLPFPTTHYHRSLKMLPKDCSYLIKHFIHLLELRGIRRNGSYSHPSFHTLTNIYPAMIFSTCSLLASNPPQLQNCLATGSTSDGCFQAILSLQYL